eukprot:gene11279-12579_t
MLFGISHLLAAVPTTQQCRIHAFDPLFYTQIKRFTSPKRIHEEGKKWIKHVNIFSMDFVLFPLVYDGHWSLFILVRPYLLLRACASNIDEETDDQPCFISVDSLNSYHDHSKVHDRLQNFVLKELSLQDMSDEDALDKRRRTSSKIRLIKAKASRQTNSDDCGIFVLMYVQALLRDYPRSTKTELDSRFESTFTNLIGTAENFRSVAKHTIDEAFSEKIENFGLEFQDFTFRRSEEPISLQPFATHLIPAGLSSFVKPQRVVGVEPPYCRVGKSPDKE